MPTGLRDTCAGSIPTVDTDVFGDAFLADPYAFHDELREAGAIFRLGAHDVFGMARHSEVSAALRDWQTYISSRGVGLSDFAHEEPWRPPSLLLETDPPVHQRTRGLMNRIVSMSALKALRPSWQAEADVLVDALVERRTVDGVHDLAEVFPLRVFPDTIGLPEPGREHLLPYAAATFNAFGPRNRLLQETEEAARDAVAWVAEACERRNLRPGGWGAQVYEAADVGLCTHEEAPRLVRSFLAAGVDTTVNGIGNLLHAFAQHPDQWARLRAEPGLLKRVFDESLRWDSTVQLFFRTTSRAVEVENVVVPEGSKILLFYGAANRDPRRWEDPDCFDVARPTSGHLAFGFGIHQCLGQMVARQEAELVLAALMRSVKEIRLVGEVRRVPNNTLHAIGSLPLELVPA